MLRQLLPRLTAILVPALVALVIHACADATGPSGVVPSGPRVAFSLMPSFQTAGPAGIVQFEKVRVIIRRADGSIALDQLVDFPVGADQVELTFNVPLSASAPPTGEPLSVNLEMLNAAGQVVFRGGPIPVVATQGTPLPPVNVPTTYTGPGATATRVELTAPALPTSGVLLPGDGLNLVARAFDQNNTLLEGTPVQFSSSNPAVVRVPNPTVGLAEAVARGTATLTATLVTGQTAELTVVVRPPATAIAAQPGTPTTAGLGTALPQPLAVRVTAADGLGVEGVLVAFAVTEGAGTLSSPTAVTNGDGVASVNLTVGGQLGALKVRATTTAIADASAEFAMTAVPGPAASLRFATQPVGGRSDEVLAPFTVEALDAFGNRATSFTGAVTVALEGGTAIVVDGAELALATLGGTATVNAVAGLATFNAVRIDGAVSGARFRASATGLAATSTSEPFTVSPLPATVMTLVNPPTTGKTGNPMRVIAEARNSRTELVPAYVGTLVTTIVSGPSGGVIVSGDRVPFVNGVATADLIVSTPGTYEFAFAASGIATVVLPNVVVVSSEPTTIELVQGPAATTTAATGVPVSVLVRDGAGELMSNVSVTWTPNGGNGTASPSSSLTNNAGVASTVWTIGTSGPQVLVASAGTATLSIATSVLGAPANLRTWNGSVSNDWHTAANWTPASVPTAGDDVVIPNMAMVDASSPWIQATATARNLTLQSGASLQIANVEFLVHGNVSLASSAMLYYSSGVTEPPPQDGNISRIGRQRQSKLVFGEYYYYGGLVMVGANTTISAAGADIYANVEVRSTVRALSAIAFGECLYVSSDAGVFDVNGQTIDVFGDFETFDGGKLKMQSASGILSVWNSAYFEGGNTTGLLTAGEVRLYGNFVQDGTGSEVDLEREARVRTIHGLSADGAESVRRFQGRARARRAGRANSALAETASGAPTPYNYETSGTHKTRFICSVDSERWNGEYCYSAYVDFTDPSESKIANLSFEGGGYWYSYGGLRVITAMQMVGNAQLYDYSYAGLTAGLTGTDRTKAINDRRLALGKAAAESDVSTLAGGRMAVYGTACDNRLCIDGTISGDASAWVNFDQLLLKGSIVGAVGLNLYRLQLHGTNQVLSQVNNPGLSFEELRVFGTVSLVPGETVASYYYGNAGVYSGGVLDLNGGTLDLDYYGVFRTVDAGVVIMDDPNSRIVAGSGDFAGGVSTLTAGTIQLGNSFTQSGTANAFDASGSHTVVFGTTAAYGAIAFGTPGSASGTSHFANLRFDGSSSITLNSTVFVNGTLSVDDNIGNLSVYGNAYRLEVGGVNIPGVSTQVRFVRAPLRVGASGPLVLNNAVFESFTATEYEDQLAITRNGGTFTLDGLQFLTPCADTWNYVVAIAGTSAPTLNFTNLSWPGTCTNKVALVGGAAVNGFNAPPAADNTWTGAVSSAWLDAANWVGGVPGLSSKVRIPGGAVHQPVITSNVSLGDLRVDGGAALQLQSSEVSPELVVYGRLFVKGNLSIAAGGSVTATQTGSGQSRLTMEAPSPATFEVEGTLNVPVTVFGPVTATRAATIGADLEVSSDGIFDAGGNIINVLGRLITRSTGRVKMTSPADMFVVLGDAYFVGAASAAQISAGEMRLHGDLIAGYTTEFGSPTSSQAYQTSGTHVTRLICNSSSPDYSAGSCTRLRLVDIDAPDEGTLRSLVLDGNATWAVPQAHVLGDLTMMADAKIQRSAIVAEETLADAPSTARLSARRAEIRQRRDALRRGERVGAPTRATVRAEAVLSCDNQLCVDGSIIGGETESFQHSDLALGGTVSSVLPMNVRNLQLRGVDQVLPTLDNSTLVPTYIEVRGSVRLRAGGVVTLPANSWVDVGAGGDLDLEGGSLSIGPGGGFQTFDGGRVVMDQSTDLLSATFFYFYGGHSTLSAGTIRVGAEIMQFTEPLAFQASGSHTVRFQADAVIDEAEYGNDFFYPWLEQVGPGESRFQNLHVATASPGDMYLDDILRVDGTFSVANGIGNLVMSGWNGTKLATPNIDIAGTGTSVTFEAVTLAILAGGTTTVLNNTTFSSFVGAFDQLEISRSSGTYSFANMAFTTACADTQRYVLASGAATFNFPGVVWPGSCTEKISVSGGATVTGFVSPP